MKHCIQVEAQEANQKEFKELNAFVFRLDLSCAASLFFTQNKKQQNDKKTSRFPSSWVWNKQGRRSLANTALLEQLKKKKQNTTTGTGRKNKTFKKLLDLVLSPALQIFILFTRANKIVVGLVL